MNKLDSDRIRQVEDFVREFCKREKRKREKESFRKQVGEVIFVIFYLFIVLVALNQGFNVCTRLDGDCKNHPENLLFTPRK